MNFFYFMLKCRSLATDVISFFYTNILYFYVLRDIEKSPHTKISISFSFSSAYSLVVFVTLTKVKYVLA